MKKFYINAKTIHNPVKYFYFLVHAADKHEAWEKTKEKYPDLLIRNEAKEITDELI